MVHTTDVATILFCGALREGPAMRFGRTLLGSTLILATTSPCFALAHSRSSATPVRLLHKHSKKKMVSRPTGQRTIDDARAEQIQTSLIKSGYLSGDVSGHWDTKTQAAMERYQGDNGWQTKLIPDSRAIIKLGLGPSQESTSKVHSSGAMTTNEIPSSASVQR